MGKTSWAATRVARNATTQRVRTTNGFMAVQSSRESRLWCWGRGSKRRGITSRFKAARKLSRNTIRYYPAHRAWCLPAPDERIRRPQVEWVRKFNQYDLYSKAANSPKRKKS